MISTSYGPLWIRFVRKKLKWTRLDASRVNRWSIHFVVHMICKSPKTDRKVIQHVLALFSWYFTVPSFSGDSIFVDDYKLNLGIDMYMGTWSSSIFIIMIVYLSLNFCMYVYIYIPHDPYLHHCFRLDWKMTEHAFCAMNLWQLDDRLAELSEKTWAT